MPIYEYICNSCGHEFEEWQKISDPPVKKCPSCGKRKVERLVSLSAFHLKGTGWYVTDYAKKSNGTDSKIKGKTNNHSTNDSATDKTKRETKNDAPTEVKCPTQTPSESKSSSAMKG